MELLKYHSFQYGVIPRREMIFWSGQYYKKTLCLVYKAPSSLGQVQVSQTLQLRATAQKGLEWLIFIAYELLVLLFGKAVQVFSHLSRDVCAPFWGGSCQNPLALCSLIRGFTNGGDRQCLCGETFPPEEPEDHWGRKIYMRRNLFIFNSPWRTKDQPSFQNNLAAPRGPSKDVWQIKWNMGHGAEWSPFCEWAEWIWGQKERAVSGPQTQSRLYPSYEGGLYPAVVKIGILWHRSAFSNPLEL